MVPSSSSSSLTFCPQKHSLTVSLHGGLPTWALRWWLPLRLCFTGTQDCAHSTPDPLPYQQQVPWRHLQACLLPTRTIGTKSPARTSWVPGAAGAQTMLAGIPATIISQFGVFVFFYFKTRQIFCFLSEITSTLCLFRRKARAEPCEVQTQLFICILSWVHKWCIVRDSHSCWFSMASILQVLLCGCPVAAERGQAFFWSSGLQVDVIYWNVLLFFFRQNPLLTLAELPKHWVQTSPSLCWVCLPELICH